MMTLLQLFDMIISLFLKCLAQLQDLRYKGYSQLKPWREQASLRLRNKESDLVRGLETIQGKGIAIVVRIQLISLIFNALVQLSKFSWHNVARKLAHDFAPFERLSIQNTHGRNQRIIRGMSVV